MFCIIICVVLCCVGLFGGLGSFVVFFWCWGGVDFVGFVLSLCCFGCGCCFLLVGKV